MLIQALHYAAIPVGSAIAHVDAQYAEFLRRFSWHPDAHGYATANVSKKARVRATVKMHRLVLRLQGTLDDDLLIDHINGGILDNRAHNLRPANRRQNAQNTRRKPSHGKTSKFKGVSYCACTGRWRAQIKTPDRTRHLGRFDSEEQAAAAYDAAARELFGAFAATGVKR